MRRLASTLYVMETVTGTDRATALDAIDTLNDLIGDLVAATRVPGDYHEMYRAGRLRPEQMSTVQKMCISHLVLAFAKLLEFWDRYHHLVPERHRSDLKSLNATLKSRGVEEFRNTVAGHIWDRKRQRPLRHSEIMEKLSTLTGGKLGEFLRWVNNPQGNTYPNTVLSVVETLRDSLVAEHRIQPGEVIER